jgi:hypothetical protein
MPYLILCGNQRETVCDRHELIARFDVRRAEACALNGATSPKGDIGRMTR